jgi:hypothetical protein
MHHPRRFVLLFGFRHDALVVAKPAAQKSAALRPAEPPRAPMRKLKIAPRSLLAKSTERSKCSRRSARMTGQVWPRLALPRRRGIGQTRLSHGRCWKAGATSSGTSSVQFAAGKMFAEGAQRRRQQHGVAEVFELDGEDFFRPRAHDENCSS